MDLNEKLARWTGFVSLPCSGVGPPCEGGDWYAPDGKKFYGTSTLPKFTEDIEACFKYLIPKCHSYSLRTSPNGHRAYVGILGKDKDNKLALGVYLDPSPCLALCKAIDQAIDT
jgi:hypothetical protein